MQQNTVLTILMATYNGAKYLQKQLDSIVKQSYRHWELIIRDDESTDETLQIIEAYCKKDPRIQLIQYGIIHGSACRNFSQLFDWAYAQDKSCICFADQDDIWLETKLERSYQAMVKQEQLWGLATPLLLYSNLRFIDANDQPIEVNLPLPSTLTLPVLLNENYAWGCTTMLNHAAIKKIRHILVDAVNHDYYIALVVAAFGKNILLDEFLILYRQHENNVSGNVDKMSFSSRFNRYFSNTDSMFKPLLDNYRLVASFYSRYQHELPEQKRLMTGGFLKAYLRGFWPLLITMLKYRIFKIGLGKNLMYVYTLALLGRKVATQFQKGGKDENTL